MEDNSSTYLYCLVVFCGFCTAVQAVDFPLEIDAIRYEGKDVTLTTYNILDSKKIFISRNECEYGWFNVWISQSPAADQQLLLSFKITEMYSVVVKVMSTVCRSTLSKFPLNIQMHFHSSDALKKFRYDEIFLRFTRVVGYNEVEVWPRDYFEYKISTMLLHNGSSARIVAKNVILQRIMIRNSTNQTVSQFHIHFTNDAQLLHSEVIFTEGFFNVSPVKQDRIVLGIWSNNLIASHIGLVFTEEVDAQNFYTSILPYTRENIKIYVVPATDLFVAKIPN